VKNVSVHTVCIEKAFDQLMFGSIIFLAVTDLISDFAFYMTKHPPILDA